MSVAPTPPRPPEPADRLVRDLATRLATAGCVAPAEEAAERVAADPGGERLDAWVTRREQGEPLAWITGSIEFCGRRVHVDPGVYVPRFQTQELARRAAALLPGAGRALDLCTGSGAVAAHLRAEVASASVVGVDRDPVAVACARVNQVPALVGDLAEAVRPGAALDLVTAVAPYVPNDDLRLLPADVQRYEPRAALAGGVDGLDLVRRIVAQAGALLRAGGWLVIEVGGDQDEALAEDLARAGLGLVTPWHDADGDLRGLAARAG